MSTRTTTVTECGWCEKALTTEEIEFPEYNGAGQMVCEECYDDECRDYCGRCGEKVDNTELAAEVGSLMGVWRSAPGLSGRVRRGYYRVKEWPIYAWGITEGYFYNRAIERLGPLDEDGRRAGHEAEAMAGPICMQCTSEVEAWLGRLPLGRARTTDAARCTLAPTA